MSTALVWFRRDLRCADNLALAAACSQHDLVIPIYIHDKDTLLLGEAQRWWLHHSLDALDKKLAELGLALVLRKGNAEHIITQLVEQYDVDAVYWNRCYEPSSIARDTQIKSQLTSQGVSVTTTNGSLLNEPWTIKTQSGDFFKVFTPYWKCCLKFKSSEPPISAPQKINRNSHITVESDHIDQWNLLPKKINWAAQFSHYWQPGEDGAHHKLEQFIQQALTEYKEARNFPDQEGTSKLSPHLHFGEISPRQICQALELAGSQAKLNSSSVECYLSELGWREFSYYLLYHFSELPTRNFKSSFDAFTWQNDVDHLRRWQKGQTGYPIVDAGMRELWQTGYMHNRVRMIVASFLVKDLLIDWRHGADWFLYTLLDADLASNSASWQWVSGSGADAAPYFRIFNPTLQGQKFDPNGEYIRRWVPELNDVPTRWIHEPWRAPEGELSTDYPAPMVDHGNARAVALTKYKALKTLKPR